MADATVAEILTQAQVHLGDPRGEIWVTDVTAAEGKTSLVPFFSSAFTVLWDRMLNEGLPRPKKVVYHNLAAYTNVLTPAQIGITDFGELVSKGLKERTASATVAVTGASNGSPIIVTAPGHTFGTNADVVFSAIGGQSGANGRFFVSVSGNFLTLNGSTSEATYTSGGIASTSAELFGVVNEEENLPQRTPTQQLQVFQWRQGRFQFSGALTARQLEITYLASGTPPTTGSVGIDNCKETLACLTAGLAAPTKDMVSEGARLMQLVFGVPNTNIKGFLFELVNPQAKGLQRITARRPRFRQKRWNADYYIA